MFLSRIHLDPRCKEARRDLANPYQLHSTLCRAFSPPDTKCPKGEFMWRLEPETDAPGYPRILVQSRKLPDWNGITVKGWLAEVDAAIDLRERLKLESLKSGQKFRFRLRANPCVTRNGKRLGLLNKKDQEGWLERKGNQHGFSLPILTAFDYFESLEERIDVRISQEQILCGKQHTDNSIRIFSVLYDGMLSVEEPELFRNALQTGIGHGKVMGLGLLSLARA
ncbi:type I-E CRISPR-associated protein Cas6/Cse3/CasE [Geobacter sulfurreducens]|uniref:type I-E CRISPR-associated protein Cas6/Cse3/CasE n=1 Tax=Geobacter sulfurreducens TaxID=35554 RepID=UPI002574585E|nr:type I-E CRISPR-associated protein Cas6/Cse3/CasE [Geobacter sulfurreducens]BEH10630.1 type I-E CRISPR-associated protein Cas6/Cse3/CasE [Geobacter sulfurreducens subsp. ethanolicus]HML79494.1 type I-E CRISPR-associated protein Cas6/Cse3/CasE [Geobacter sulfurreducens]